MTSWFAAHVTDTWPRKPAVKVIYTTNQQIKRILGEKATELVLDMRS